MPAQQRPAASGQAADARDTPLEAPHRHTQMCFWDVERGKWECGHRRLTTATAVPSIDRSV